ncbi:RNA-dependent DNA polymerase [Candidatus Saganbacteria bacterium]|nr:RNA-dependent DNA polymerase [Candidatus Saganbacteria bacterium]
MKRHGNLFDKLCSFENLLIAVRKAQRGKRFKPPVSAFNLNFENEILKLQKELQDQTYQIGCYKQFQIYDPKKRLISALPYRDRVVQHALCNILEPIFDRSFVYDTYACRKDKGSHKAVNRFTEFSQKNSFVLKCDVKNYFASIDHDVLFGLIRKKTKDPQALWLIKLIINSTPSPGIPIGNLASQIFANLYLNELDHYLKETVKCRYYLHYMDDLVVFDDDKNKLNDIKEIIRKYLICLKLELHTDKSQSYSVKQGVGFLGYKIYPTHRLVICQNIRRLRKRIKSYLWLLQQKVITKKKIICSIQSWIGYAMHADSYNLRRRIFAQYEFIEG